MKMTRLRMYLMVIAVAMTSCAAPPHYVFNKQRENDKRKPFIVPANSKNLKGYDHLADLFPGVKNLPRRAEMSGHLLQTPRVLATGDPLFPPTIGNRREIGDLAVVVLISERGEVLDAKLVKSTKHSLDAAALESARRWKFLPATLDGRPIKFIFGMPFYFRTTH
jgi:TonB family protein